MGPEGSQDPVRVRCLSFHASYACQNTGVCCSSGWQIAVETQVEWNLVPRLRAPGVRLPNGPEGFQPMAEPPPGCRAELRQDPSGVCWFRDPVDGRCAVHREFGETSLPSACRQFPRVCVLAPDQVSVSLSHYCPTAAALLFGPPDAFGLVDRPRAFPASWPFEGLDVRASYSPFLRPRTLLGFDGLRALEDSATRILGEPGVLAGLARVRNALAAIGRWTPAHGPVPEYVLIAFDHALPEPAFEPEDPRLLLRTSVPVGAPGAPELPGFTKQVPELSALADLGLRRYLAARLFAGWIAYQADGLAAVARYLTLCLDTVFLFESARDRDEPELARWKESIRTADLWLVHHCDPALLAANLG